MAYGTIGVVEGDVGEMVLICALCVLNPFFDVVD